MAPHDISRIHVYNRSGNEMVAGRALPLAAELSDDGVMWKILRVRHEPIDRMGTPWVIALDLPVRARFLRLRITRVSCLHLDEVEVFAEPVPSYGGVHANA